jgi:hypothetical protein
MTANAMNLYGEILGIAVGAAGLLIFGILTALLSTRPKIPPGSKGRREKGDEGTHETIAGDGYIDSFAGVIEEAGGRLPPLVIVSLIVIPIWWLAYMIINWSPYLVNIITIMKSTYRP